VRRGRHGRPLKVGRADEPRSVSPIPRIARRDVTSSAEHAASAGGPLWCNTRAVTIPFYARHDWTIARDEFIISIDARTRVMADSPAGPWQRFEGNPVLSPSDDPAKFDSARVDDSAFLVRDGRVWLYYKGRMKGKTPEQTKMGVAFGDGPTGPFTKYGEPLHQGHEPLIWTQGGGVGSLATAAGPRRVYYAADGLHFEAMNPVEGQPSGPGAWREDHFQNNFEGDGLRWGISQIQKDGDVYLVRYDCVPSPDAAGDAS
jgi:hypothetical protein